VSKNKLNGGKNMEVSVAQIKELRALTGAGMMDCKKALLEAKGDLVEATNILRRKGLASLREKAGRETKEGVIEAYIHANNKIGVLVEINCETDFVARNEEFKKFAHDIAMQVAAANPNYVSREDVPDSVVEKELEIYRSQAIEEGKPNHIIDKIAQGRLEKFFQSVCLLEQPFIKEPEKNIKEYLAEIAGKIGENIGIKRFVRFELGE
jgi:elongation factor Ts